MSMKALFYNINFDQNVEDGYASNDFYDWKLKNRLTSIMTVIKNNMPTFVSLVEVSSTHRNDVVNELVSLGYRVIHGAYSPNQYPEDKSLYYVFGFDESYTLINSYMYWFTNTPLNPLTDNTRKVDPVLLECNQDYERGTLICIFEKDNSRLVISSYHLGDNKQYQIKSNQLFLSHIISFSNMKIIIGGDFSDFVQDTISAFENVGFKHCDNNKFTFVGYPYDLGTPKTPEQETAISETMNKLTEMSGYPHQDVQNMMANAIVSIYGAPLTSTYDHVFVMNTNNNVLDVLDNGLNNDSNLTRTFLENGAHSPLTPSDHFPLLLNFYY